MKTTTKAKSLKDQLSPSIKPGDDFFNYVNKKWLDAHPIPADKSRFGVMEQLSDNNLESLSKLLEAKIKDDEDKMIKLVKAFYQAAMDEAAIAAGTDDLIMELRHPIEALKSPSDIVDFLAKSQNRDIGLVWGVIIEPDDKNSKEYMVRFWQGGLGLPERTYYLEDNEQFQAVRKHYLDYLAGLFKLLKLDQPAVRAKRVLALERKLAEASVKAADLRDPERIYNPYTLKKLQADYPSIDWSGYLAMAGLRTEMVNVGQPQFLAEVNRLIKSEPLIVWQDFLTAHTMTTVASKLSEPFEQLHFNFYGKVLAGKQAQEPRWLRMTRACMIVLPEPTGRLFVEHFFHEDAKTEIYDLVKYLQKALSRRIDQLEWMSADTKKQAHHKLSTFLPLLGYPDKWRNFDKLEFGANYARNTLAAAAFEWSFQTAKIGQPVDRTEWLMSPALVNAYYWPNSNGITFPAGILQPPFFDAKGDFAANYGAIGAVIGHELTHGFDDQGSQFDADGNLKTWWTAKDRQDFDARAERLAKQYSQYEIAGRKIDGKLTLGENIADLGGLLVAFDALKAKIKESGQWQKIDGFTPEQRFFLSYSVTWCTENRQELLLQRLVADPHSPEIYRVNGVVPNFDAFYEAFGVQPGDKLYLEPAQRVRIW